MNNYKESQMTNYITQCDIKLLSHNFSGNEIFCDTITFIQELQIYTHNSLQDTIKGAELDPKL